MNNKIIISINPEHVDNILSGKKKYEYRKIAAKKQISSIIIYETTPIKRIVAEAEIVDVLMFPPDELWELTKDDSGVTKTFFDSYFRKNKTAYAYKLGKITVFETPKSLKDFGLKYPPQSFIYI